MNLEKIEIKSNQKERMGKIFDYALNLAKKEKNQEKDNNELNQEFNWQEEINKVNNKGDENLEKIDLLSENDQKIAQAFEDSAKVCLKLEKKLNDFKEKIQKEKIERQQQIKDLVDEIKKIKSLNKDVDFKLIKEYIELDCLNKIADCEVALKISKKELYEQQLKTRIMDSVCVIEPFSKFSLMMIKLKDKYFNFTYSKNTTVVNNSHIVGGSMKSLY